MKHFDIQSLKQLLCDFYHLTNIKVCLYDIEENELYFYPKRHTSQIYLQILIYVI